MDIFYVTSNSKKFEEACHTLSNILLKPLELDELQGSCYDIAHHKALQAFQILAKPVIIDDVSVHCPALKGLPGPYIRSFLESLGEAGLYELISHYEDRSCFITCTIGYMTETLEEPLIFEGTIKATIVPPKGTLAHGKHSWNKIVQIDGFEKTVGEMTLAEYSQNSPRGLALKKLQAFLEKSTY